VEIPKLENLNLEATATRSRSGLCQRNTGKSLYKTMSRGVTGSRFLLLTTPKGYILMVGNVKRKDDPSAFGSGRGVGGKPSGSKTKSLRKRGRKIAELAVLSSVRL